MDKRLAGIPRVIDPVAATQDKSVAMWEPPRKTKARVPSVLAVAVHAEIVAQLCYAVGYSATTRVPAVPPTSRVRVLPSA